MDGKIVIDRDTLRALGADTRVNILKKLGERRKTQAELAAELDLAAPSVKEHVQRLAQAGLVKRIESERKWKYYELTEKGTALVRPSETRIWFMLAISLVAIAASFTSFYSKLQVSTGQFAAEAPRTLAAEAAPALAETAALPQAVAPALMAVPWLELAVFAAALVAAGACAAVLARRR
ncbi:MAG: winged helix-turn-helix domain-containing protein [Candidatus Micrarchaeota archaeon]